MHFEARVMHFEAKMMHFEAKTKHFEAKMRHFDPKPLKSAGFGPGASHLKIMVPLGFKYAAKTARVGI